MFEIIWVLLHEFDHLLLDLKYQVKHLKRSLKSAILRYDDLKIEHDFLKDLTKVMMSKSEKLFGNTLPEKNYLIDSHQRKESLGLKSFFYQIVYYDIDHQILISY